MTQYELMKAGRIYDPGDEEILKEQGSYQELLYEYNHLKPGESEKKQALLKKMLVACGQGCAIEAPFYANWGGAHLFLGDYVYANFGLTVVDDANIYVGSRVKFGPHVTLATAGHPITPALREKGLQFNRDIHIGDNVWIGAGAIILPGISIGKNSVIGAGSIVTHDIPENVVAVGNPARAMRAISDEDRKREEKLIG